MLTHRKKAEDQRLQISIIIYIAVSIGIATGYLVSIGWTHGVISVIWAVLLISATCSYI